MPKTRPPYPVEFREQMVALARAGRTPAQLSREFGVAAQSISNWLREAGEEDPSSSEALSGNERAELSRLRRQVVQLQTERDILAKATAWFAGRSEKTPTSSSS